MKIKAIIFDMDGVLIDSEPFWAEAIVEVFARYGISLHKGDPQKTRGLRIAEVVDYWLEVKGRDRSLTTTLVQKILERVNELVLERGKIFEGVGHVMKIAYDHHLMVAVATSSPRFLAENFLDKVGIKADLKVIRTGETVEYAKPHPEIYLLTARDLGVDPTECLVIEDSVQGVIAAKAARMFCFAIPEKAQQNDPRFAIADRKLSGLSQIDFSMIEPLG